MPKSFLRKPTKKHLSLAIVMALACVMTQTNANDLDDAFNAASNTAKQSKNQGANTLNNNSVNNTVPSATTNPPQAGYYGGVKGNSHALDAAKESVPMTDETYQAISDADKKNPPTVINPDADFIQNGAKIETDSPNTVTGESAYCSTNVVSKSVFQNYNCDKDVASERTCTRAGTIQVVGSKETYNTQLVMNAGSSTPNNEDNYWIRYDFTVPEDGTISSGTWEFLFPKSSSYHGDRLGYSMQAMGQSVTFKLNNSGAFNINPQHVTKGQIVSLRVRYNTDGHYSSARDGVSKNINSGKYIARITLPLLAERDTTSSQIVWSESCGFDKSTAVAQTESICTDPGGNRTVNQNGRDYTQNSSCWQYTDSYIVPIDSQGNCSTLAANKNCTVVKRDCTDSQNNTCMHEQDTYQCQETYTSEGKICGGNYFCQSGDCANTQAGGDNQFGQAVAELAAVAAAGEDTKKTAPTVSVFTGKAVSCRKAMAGFENCCVDKGWGGSLGLAHCNSEEKAIGEAKEKKVIIKVGTYCGKKALGVCIQKKESYCQFEGKLAKIIQQQGRLQQLHISFGDASSPNCRGLTVAELQSVNFDNIDYSDFYSDLENKVALPGNQETIDRIKAKINTQVSNMGGGQ